MFNCFPSVKDGHLGGNQTSRLFIVECLMRMYVFMGKMAQIKISDKTGDVFLLSLTPQWYLAFLKPCELVAVISNSN